MTKLFILSHTEARKRAADAVLKAPEYVTHKRLLELVQYAPETGQFVRRINPRKDGQSRWKAGTVSGSKNADGYVCTQIDGRKYLAHRLAWFYIYGEWPLHQIDHINRIKYDNRIENLREATNKQNSENKRIGESGFIGVSFDSRKRKWRARIMHNHKEIWLGHYENAESAHAAYIDAAKKLFTHSQFVISK